MWNAGLWPSARSGATAPGRKQEAVGEPDCKTAVKMKENRAFVPSLSSPALGGLPRACMLLCSLPLNLVFTGTWWRKTHRGVGFCSDIINNNHHHHLSFPSRMFEKQISNFFGEEIQDRWLYMQRVEHKEMCGSSTWERKLLMFMWGLTMGLTSLYAHSNSCRNAIIFQSSLMAWKQGTLLLMVTSHPFCFFYLVTTCQRVSPSAFTGLTLLFMEFVSK